MKFLPAFLFIAFAALPLQAQQVYKWSKTETLADTLLNRRQVFEALKLYNRVIRAQEKEKFTGQTAVRFKRAICYYYLGAFNQALADLNVFISQNPDIMQGKLIRAYVYRELDKYDEQLADLNALIGTDSYNIDLRKWRAGLLLEMNRAEDALNDLMAIRQFYNDEEIELNLGLAWYYLGDPDEALAHFNEAIFINGGYSPAYRYAATLLIEQGQHKRALEYINLALLLDPDDLNLVFSKGIALAETGHTNLACSYLNKAFYGGIEEAAGYLEHYCYSGGE